MIKEKYKQLCLARQFDGINTIEFIQALAARLKDRIMKEILSAYKRGIARPQIAHLVFADTQANPGKTKRAIF